MSRVILINPEDKTADVEFRKAWNSKLVNIDKYISWLSSKGFLTKGEKQRKDTLYRQYYRWYNDGDLPAVVRSKGFSKDDMTSRYRTENTLKYSGEYQLELIIDDFIRKIITKYLPKHGRKEFREDMKMGWFWIGLNA